MEILYALSIIVIWFLTCLLARYTTTFVHEMGHALPALAYTQKEVAVLIGSYGEKEIKSGFKIGRLIVLIDKNVVRANIGMCAFFEKLSPAKNLVISLGGPLASLACFFITITVLSLTSWSNGTISLVAIFALSFLWDFIVNIIPMSSPHMMSNGTVLYNDGEQIKQYWSESRLTSDYKLAEEKWNAGDQPAAIELLENMLSNGDHSKVVYRRLISYHQDAKAYQQALEVSERFAHRHEQKAPDFYQKAQLLFKINEYNDALKSVRQATHLDYQNSFYLTLQGDILNALSEYKKAILKFNGALQYDESMIEALIGRARAAVRLEQLEAARTDLEQAQKIEASHRKDVEDQVPENPNLSLVYAFYYQALGQKIAARDAFVKAKELGSDHHGLDFFIEDLEQKTSW